MTKEYVNGNLCVCDECLLDIKSKLKSKVEFPINSINNEPSDKSSDRESILRMIISKLSYDLDIWAKGPEYVKTKILTDMINHGQFTEDEIESVFKEFEYETTDYSYGFLQEHPELDVIDFDCAIIEKNYNFPVFGCDIPIVTGYCKVDVETLVCPDCGSEVQNIPENCTGGCALICPKCLNDRRDIFDIFDTTGLVRKGNPPHHGNWGTQVPEFIRTSTDYFGILHPFCKKSPRDDGKGVMCVSGVWIDDTGRVVLSLECAFCGAENVLKPFTKAGKIPLLDVSGAEWEIKSRLYELINAGENERVEFKSSMRWDYKENRPNKNLEGVIMKTISAFLNSSGGTLLIGVDDFGIAIGIEKDIKTLGGGKKNLDGFELQLTELVGRYLGKEHRKFFHVSFVPVDKKNICVIEIDKSPKPVFLEYAGKTEFVVRSGNSSQILNAKEQYEYIKMHWK